MVPAIPGKEAADQVINAVSSMTNMTKQRIKLNVKVLGVQIGQNSEGQPTGQAVQEKTSYREHFTPPEMSIVSKFMAKVIIIKIYRQNDSNNPFS